MTDQVKLPAIEPFSDCLLEDHKALAVKVLEEASEVFGAWQLYDSWADPRAREEHGGPVTVTEQQNLNKVNKGNVLYEICDVMQACVNLACAVTGLMPEYVTQCLAQAYGDVHKANEERGRYDRERD